MPHTLAVRCSWCGRYKVGDYWLWLLTKPSWDRTTHSICPSCFQEQLAKSWLTYN